MRLGQNTAIFVLFFGVAMLDAIGSNDWLRAGLWFALGLVFLWGDFKPKE